MSDAFRCDECGDYYDGRPAEKLLTKGGPRHDTVLRAELRESCSHSFAGGPPEEFDE